MRRIIGVAALIAGGIVASIAANGGQFITCGKWSGCTTHTDALQNFSDVVLVLAGGGIGLIALGVFLLVPKNESSKPSFGKSGRRNI